MIVPPHDLTRACVAVVVLFIDIRFHAVPFTVNVVTVCVVPAVNNRECATVPVSLISAKVLDHDTVILAVDAPRANQTLLYVLPAHANV